MRPQRAQPSQVSLCCARQPLPPNYRLSLQSIMVLLVHSLDNLSVQIVTSFLYPLIWRTSPDVSSVTYYFIHSFTTLSAQPSCTQLFIQLLIHYLI